VLRLLLVVSAGYTERLGLIPNASSERSIHAPPTTRLQGGKTMSKTNGTATIEKKAEAPAQSIPAPNEIETLSAYPMEHHGTYPKFELHIDSSGKNILIIRTDNEDELEGLLDTWEPILRPEYEPQQSRPTFSVNGQQKVRYYGGDNCPLCSNKLVTRRGRRGRFIGCSAFPNCEFTSS
jgi:hypothetical protein